MRALSRIMAATIVSVATAAGRLPAAGSDDRLAAPPTAGAEPSADDIARLITALGDADYAVRETAAARLSALGPPAADALLTAAETTTDLEVALRARWLAESIAAGSPDDPPEVAAELTRFARADFDTRVRIMHRLLRLDDDAGIEPLARIVRLERSLAGSRVAAALLAREWRPPPPRPTIRRRQHGGPTRPRPRWPRSSGAAVRAIHRTSPSTWMTPPATRRRCGSFAAA
jgi:HEAT repeat protein